MNYVLYLMIGLGGALGAISRFTLSTYIYQKYTHIFPWGTFMVNMLGCFLIGVVYILGAENVITNPNTRSLLSVGFLGAFTTFSTFSYETLNIIKNGEFKIAFLYAVGSLVTGLLAVWLGLSLTNSILK